MLFLGLRMGVNASICRAWARWVRKICVKTLQNEAKISKNS
jgi:hypothetical protein